MRRVRVLGAVMAATMLIAACGGSDGETSDGGSSGSDSGSGAASAEVSDLAAELQERPTAISVTEEIGAEIPSDKTIMFISCGVPACDTLGEKFGEGAEELGWTVETVNTDGSPEQIKAAWGQAVESKPDAVVSSGTDVATIKPELDALAAADIPVLQFAIPEKVNGVTVLITDCEGEARSFGEPMAAFVSEDSDASASTLFVTLPNYPILECLQEGFTTTYDEGCPDCDMEVMELPLTSLGKDVPERIVSALRANPEIDYVVMTVDDLTSGLPAALQAAGLADKVKIVGASSGTTNFQYIEAGQQAAGVPNAFFEQPWQWVQALALIFTDQSPETAEVDPPRMIVTADNLPAADEIFPLVEDYRDQYLALWGLGS